MIRMFEWMRKIVICLILFLLGESRSETLQKNEDLVLFVKVVENIYKRWSDDYWTWSYSNFNKKNSVNFELGWIKPTGLKWSSFMHPWGRTRHSSTAFSKLMRPSHPSKKNTSWESNFESLAKLFGQYVFGGRWVSHIPPHFFSITQTKNQNKPLGICPPISFGASTVASTTSPRVAPHCYTLDQTQTSESNNFNLSLIILKNSMTPWMFHVDFDVKKFHGNLLGPWDFRFCKSLAFLPLFDS